MVASVRYKFIKNNTGVPYTRESFPMQDDGDDKQFKQMKRVLTASDIGTDPGETGHELGAIVVSIPSTYNVLWFIGSVNRPQTKIGNVTPYLDIDNVSLAGDILSLSFLLDEQNNIRVKSDNSDAPFAAGDVVNLFYTLGVANDPQDIINP